MASVNKVILIGNLGKDPDTKYSANGVKIVRFSIATSEKFKRGDNWEENTDWHNIVLFGSQAEYASEYLKKGNTVYIEGRIQYRSWEDDKGQKRYMTEIMGSIVRNLTRRDYSSSSSDSSYNQDSKNDSMEETEDDLPF